MNSLINKKIVILGAGIIGLSTAYRLIELFEEGKQFDSHLDITIISENFSKDTTSDGAGGLFRPDDRFMGGVPKGLAKKWCVDSFKYFDRLLFNHDGGKAGIFQSSGYQLFDDVRIDPSYKDIVYQFRHLTTEELQQFPSKFNFGYFSTTICIDSRVFMKYLTDKLAISGVKFVQKTLDKLENFIDENDFDFVFNCLGIGNLTFCSDKKLIPIRGQMIRVKAPWIKHFYYTDDNCYIIPNIDTICLGGTRQLNNFSLKLDQNDSKGIFERCKKLCPSLENATIEWEWVGLRPHREPTRVEREVVQNKNKKKIIIIHNYGHGGNGISLSRGTSMHAVDLLLDYINNSAKLKSNL